jgi:hypothetical protein
MASRWVYVVSAHIPESVFRLLSLMCHILYFRSHLQGLRKMVITIIDVHCVVIANCFLSVAV